MGLLSWWRRWRRPQRAIFEFWDGQRTRRADPLRVYRELRAHAQFDADVHLELAEQFDDEESLDACLAAARDVFGVVPLEEGGLTQAEMLELLYSFVYYVADVKKNTDPPPTSPEPMAQASSDENWSETTNSSAAFPGTETGLKPDAPPPSVPLSPSD